MAPRIAAIALWLKKAWLSNTRFWSLPLSIAIRTTLWTESTGVIVRVSRDSSLRAFFRQPVRHTPHQRHDLMFSHAFPLLGLTGSFAKTSDIASTGQGVTHLLQPTHLSSEISGIKVVVNTVLRNPGFLAAVSASQQHPQPLQMKPTFSCTFSHIWKRLNSRAFWRTSRPSATSTFLAIPCLVRESVHPLNVIQISSSGAWQFFPTCSILCLQ